MINAVVHVLPVDMGVEAQQLISAVVYVRKADMGVEDHLTINAAEHVHQEGMELLVPQMTSALVLALLEDLD